MKLQALMVSAAVLLGSASFAFAQTYSQPPQTPAGPTSPQSGTSMQQNMNDSAPAGSKSDMSQPGPSAAQSNVQPGSTGTKQAQSQPPRTGKHRAMASRRYEPRSAQRDRATTALNLLEEKGYRDFSSFRQTGRDYAITASQNGKSVNVVVNPDTRTVRTQG